MWGMACGTLAGLHKFRMYRGAPRKYTKPVMMIVMAILMTIV